MGQTDKQSYEREEAREGLLLFSLQEKIFQNHIDIF